MTRFSGITLGVAVLFLAGECIGSRAALAQNGQIALSPSVVNSNSNLTTELESLPPQILAVADYGAKMRIMQHCNRLVMTRGNVTRTFVADPRIAEVVQFRSNELVLTGLETGRTTVTLWFEDSPEPLIYLIEIVDGPVSTRRMVGQNPNSTEAAQITAYANRRKQDSGAATRQRPANSVKPVAADAGLSPVNLSQRQRGTIPFRGRYDGHAPWPSADRKMPNAAVPIEFDGIPAGHAKFAR
jgi:Flp pilus assembly secretin CpaC